MSDNLKYLKTVTIDDKPVSIWLSEDGSLCPSFDTDVIWTFESLIKLLNQIHNWDITHPFCCPYCHG